MDERARELVSRMTLEEKASLCSGSDTWHTQPIPRLGLPAVMMADGPHGLRKQAAAADHLGLNRSVEAVCFPAACASACSFDPELLEELGAALGEACAAEGIALLLGPGANLKRSPLCGRNFEYFSEDPYLSGKLAAALIRGVQSRGPGATVKHFAVNNQETRRMSVSAEVLPRPLRELYLSSFETAVKEGAPRSVMCSYNRLGGTYVSENPFLLTRVLRVEWGYGGFVVSDWGAVNDRVRALAAGMDLEMPGCGGIGDAQIAAAVRGGALDEAVLDRAAERIVSFVLRSVAAAPRRPYDKDRHHALARKIASESIVLLQNRGALPLREGGRYAFIGPFAEAPRYQGGGSSNINAFRVDSALDAAQEYGSVTFVRGFTLDGAGDDALLAEAVAAAKAADGAVVFAGLPDEQESEGYDRTDMELPANQNVLISALAAVQPNLTVVLHNGAPVSLPWAEESNAILEAYLGGQAVGGAVCDVLFGRVNPSGKLAETFPLRLEDTPAYLNFPGEGDRVDYAEGLFVGYRWYDKRKMSVRFPFGHGLSYTTFRYDAIDLSAERIPDTGSLTATVTLTNVGDRPGKEAVQLYVTDDRASVIRPERELKGFAKIALAPGETGCVSFPLDARAFAFWNESAGDWTVESGTFTLRAGGSSRDLPLEASVTVDAPPLPRERFHLNSTLGDLMAHPRGKALLSPRIEAFIAQMVPDAEQTPELFKTVQGMAENLPLRGLVSMSGGSVTPEMLDSMLDAING